MTKPTGRSDKYHQGRFTPTNPDKYVGNVANIIYRSSWEKKLLIRLDRDPSILKYSSEEMVIPYISPVDGRPHRYFVDFTIVFKTKTGEIKKALIEVKPFSQTQPPKQKSRKTKRFITEVLTYETNIAKWEAAKEWCSQNGFMFIIMTERELGI